MKRVFLKNQAITLIALIITIIVLLILAGVSISLVIGDNGILNQAVNGADRTNIESAIEKIEMEVIASYDETGQINIDTLKSNLEKNLEIDTSNFGENLPSGNIKLNNFDFFIDENGEVINGIRLSSIITSNNYGDYINYPIDLNEDNNFNNDWRIFYNNGKNIFLIASDYIKGNSKYLDLNSAEMYFYGNYNSNFFYSVYWYNPNNSTDTLYIHTGNNYINNNIAKLFMYNTYYSAYHNSTYTNAKATSSLLDTTVWQGFLDKKYGEYSIGSPTLEMWIESWNQNYTTLYSNYNETGYYIGTIENPTTFKQDLTPSALDNSGYNNSLYFPYTEEVNNCYGYWLASPSANYSEYLLRVAYDGTIYYNATSTRSIFFSSSSCYVKI